MADSKSRACALCRKAYSFCPRCPQDADKPTYFFTFCSENCKDIYHTTSAFENGTITADEAKAQLDKLDLSKLDSFGESYKSSITKITSQGNSASIPFIYAEDVIPTAVEVEETTETTETVETVDESADTTDSVEVTEVTEDTEIREIIESLKRRLIAMLNSDLLKLKNSKNIIYGEVDTLFKESDFPIFYDFRKS
jgi:endogenous inhibitor of DNA gyrase (YacG/DUF329 family)